MALYSVEIIVKIVRSSGEHLDIQQQHAWSSPVREWRSESKQLAERVAERLIAEPKETWIAW